MGNKSLVQFTVYMTAELADATRSIARRRACSVSHYLKSLVALDQENDQRVGEQERHDLRYVRTGVDALLDELWKIRQPPPVSYRSPGEKTLKQRVRELHASRVGDASDAN